MTETQREQYRYLWDGSNPEWILLQDDEHSEDFSIYNHVNPQILLIEDDDLHAEICTHMRERGCRIVNVNDVKVAPVIVELK